MPPVSKVGILTTSVPKATLPQPYAWTSLDHRARQVVEGYLRIDRFIERCKTEIFTKLEENFRRAQEHDKVALMFVAESLPVAFSIVHVGSHMVDFRHARDCVKEHLPDAEPISILSTLTLAYTVRKGYEEFSESDNADKRALWASMNKQMQQLIS